MKNKLSTLEIDSEPFSTTKYYGGTVIIDDVEYNFTITSMCGTGGHVENEVSWPYNPQSTELPKIEKLILEAFSKK